MSIPHANITPIPANEPDAVPSLWNTRYTEIDQNFSNIDGRVVAHENELASARGGSSIAARLAVLDASAVATGVDMANMDVATLKFALEQAALANKGVNDLHKISQQQGIFTIRNTGVISGCGLTKNALGNRDFTCAAGMFFAGGRKYGVALNANSGNVPENNTADTLYCYVYLTIAGECLVTELVAGTITADAIVPPNCAILARLAVPTNSTNVTQPNISDVTVTTSGYLRTESAYFPTQLDAPASATITLPYILPDTEYAVHFEVESSNGAPMRADMLEIAAKNTNYFTVQLNSAADNVVVRYKLSRLNAVNSKNTLI